MKQKIRILHLEDSPRDAALIENKLVAAGLSCQIIQVDDESGFESALAAGSFDVILCDYNLPDYDGLSALKVAREKHPVTPVMLISGTLGEEEAVKCLQLGATDYLLKQRLDRLPAAVTRALHEAAEHLKRRQAEFELEQTHAQLLAVSRQAGMAEFATDVLHNVGNVLNSVNVATTYLADSLRKSKSTNLAKVVALMRQHEADLGNFLTHDPQGKQVTGYLAKLADVLAGEQTMALKELGELQKNVEHIKNIITMQQDSAKMSRLTEALKLTDLVEDAFKMNMNGLQRNGIQVIKEFEEIPPIMTEKHKVLQILVNLVRNAMQACEGSSTPEKRLTIRVSLEAGRVRIAVADNGSGILPEHLSRIFAHGFTTKKEGHGFGLHGAALAAQEMGGSLAVQSEGPGRGATFTLELPMKS